MNYRSQDLTKFFQDAGQCYWHNIKKYQKYKIPSWTKTLPLELKKYEVQDIDTIEDFKMAEKIYKLKN